MAAFYRDPSGNYGLRRNDAEEELRPTPPGSTVVRFDEGTNQAILDSLGGKVQGFLWQDHTIAGSQILRSGAPLTINPDSATQQDKADFDGQLVAALARLGQIKTVADGGFPNNTQRDTAIGDLAVMLRRTLKLVAQLRKLQR